MTDRDLTVICRQCTGKCSRRISMYKYNIRSFFLQHFPDTSKHSLYDFIQGLSLLHNIQIIFRYNMESLQYLIQHLTVLCRNTGDLFDLRSGF